MSVLITIAWDAFSSTSASYRPAMAREAGGVPFGSCLSCSSSLKTNSAIECPVMGFQVGNRLYLICRMVGDLLRGGNEQTHEGAEKGENLSALKDAIDIELP